jgi:HPt (histidine-containing phosphotransfer) domain-containing protein
MNNVPVLDRNLLLDLTEGDTEFEHELIGTYRASAKSILARLRAGLSAGELAHILREAHALRGASLNIGATAMGQCAAAIETAARDGDLAMAHRAARRLDAEEVALWAELDRM